MDELYIEDFFQSKASKKMEETPLDRLEEFSDKNERRSSLSYFKELKKAIEHDPSVSEMLFPYLRDIEKELESDNRENILVLTDQIEELLDVQLLTKEGC